MMIERGQTARIELELSGADLLHPVWLVGALAAKYPGADVVTIEHRPPHYAAVTLRARKAMTVSVGDAVTPVIEGLPAEFATHSAVVTVVSATGAQEDVRLPAGVTSHDLWKLGLAAVMISTVAYAIHRIGGKGEHARAA